MADRNTREIAGFCAVIVASFVVMLLLRPAAPGPPIRSPLALPPDEALHPQGAFFDVSSDGELLLYRRQRIDGAGELWIRRFDEAGGALVPETTGAGQATLSPDRSEVAFTTEAAPFAVRTVSLSRPGARTLVDSAGRGGVGWSPDGGWVYFTNVAGGLSRVSSEGGRPEVLTRPGPIDDALVHWGVEALPRGEAVLFTESDASGADARIKLLALGTGEVRDVWSGGSPRYHRSGFLLFREVDASTLLALPFDAERLDVTGSPVRALDGLVLRDDEPLFAVSETGTLVYARFSGGDYVTPVWVARDGSAVEIEPGWKHRGHPTYSGVALSPSGDRLVVSIPSAEGSWDLWLKPVSPAGVLTRLTFEGAFNYRPRWLADERRVTFLSDRSGQSDVWSMSVDDPSSVALTLDRERVIRNGFYAPGEQWLIFREGEAPVADIRAIRTEPGATAIPVVVTGAGERSPAVSPNGRWVAHTTNETGYWQVWVTSFGGESPGRWRISSDGGEEPVWARSGRELFFRNRANQLVVVAVSEDPVFRPGPEVVLFSMDGFLGSDGRAQYDVSPDDERFVMLRLTEAGDLGLVRIENFFEELRSRPEG